MPAPPPPTRLTAPPFVPQLRLHLAPAGTALFPAGGYRSDEPPPFWAFAWPGGQALARYLLDGPAAVAGRRVLDLGTGSGIVAVAAALAGAAGVRAVDVDPAAVAAARRNAAANGVTLDAAHGDPLDGGPGDAEVVLAGDAFYSAAMAGRVLGFLRRAARGGATVLVADPDRGYLPDRLFERVAAYRVPVDPALEDGERSRSTTIWRLGPG